MIHYHGMPMNPADMAIRFMSGRHALVSYHRPQMLDALSDVVSSFVIDNGAFTAWKSGKAFDFSGYDVFVRSWGDHPSFDWCLIPDVIDGSEEDNDRLIANWKFKRSLSVPVWHYHESFDRLYRLTRDFSRVVLGSSGDFATVGTSAWWERTQAAWEHVDPLCKIHGLRMLSPAVFTKVPLSSADSCNIAMNIKIDKKWKGTYQPATLIGRANVLADRIESQHSSRYLEMR